MMKKFALCAVLALALGLVACSSEETVAPPDAGPVSGAVTKDSDFEIFLADLDADFETIPAWHTLTFEIPATGGVVSAPVPGWPVGTDFVLIVGPSAAKSDGWPDPITVSCDVPDADYRVTGNCLPLRWWGLSALGDRDVSIVFTNAPWQDLAEYGYQYHVYNLDEENGNFVDIGSRAYELFTNNNRPYVGMRWDFVSAVSRAEPTKVVGDPGKEGD